MRRSWVGLLSILPLLAVVLGSAWWASFRSLSWVGAQINIDPGWVLAASVDGGIALGLAAAMTYAGGPRRLKAVIWSIVGLGSVTSVAANVAHSGTGNGWHLAAGAVPALMLGLAIELAILAARQGGQRDEAEDGDDDIEGGQADTSNVQDVHPDSRDTGERVRGVDRAGQVSCPPVRPQTVSRGRQGQVSDVDRARSLLSREPGLSNTEAARRLSISVKTVSRARKPRLVQEEAR